MEKSTDKEYKFSPITDKQIKAMGVQALATRPNAAGQYGQSGLSPAQLKLWFDKLVILVIEKINEMQEAINGDDAAKYIGLALKNYETLDALIVAMQDGRFARDVLKVFPSAAAFEPQALENVIFGIAESVSELEEDKLDKKNPGVLSAYSVDAKGENITKEISNSPKAGAIPAYDADGGLLVEDPKKLTSAMNLRYFVNYMNELATHIGAGVTFTLDPKTYIVTIEVLNIAGKVIYKTELDLPLEQMIVNIEYENGEIILTLKTGEKRRVPVDAIVGGLASDEELKREIGKVNARLDDLFEGYIDDINELVGEDYADYS